MPAGELSRLASLAQRLLSESAAWTHSITVSRTNRLAENQTSEELKRHYESSKIDIESLEQELLLAL